MTENREQRRGKDEQEVGGQVNESPSRTPPLCLISLLFPFSLVLDNSNYLPDFDIISYLL